MLKQHEYDQLLKATKWLIAVRLIIVSVVFGIGSFVLKVELLPFYGAIGFFYLCTLIYLIFIAITRISQRWQILIQLTFDVLSIIGVLHFSGGLDSVYISMILFPLIAAGILLPWSWCMGLLSLATVSYMGLIYFEFFGPFVFLRIESLVPRDIAEILYLVCLHLVVFWIIGFLSATLARQLHLTTSDFYQLKQFHDIILDQIGSGILTVNTKNEIVYINKGALQLIGASAEELIGENWKSLFFFTNANFPNNPWDELSQDIRGYEVSLRKKNGVKIPIGFNVTPLTDQHNQYCGKVMIFRDLTRIKELEQKKSQAERLAAIGEMAAGIAHEIRNPLTSISGSVEVLLNKKAFDEKYSGLVDVILREAQRLNNIIENFLVFTRRPELEKRFMNLETVLDEVTTLLHHSGKLRKNIKIIKENRLNEACQFWFDPNQMKQVFYNLISNSCEAMPEGGLISIYLSESIEKPLYIQIDLKDSGQGIPEDKITKIFTPFFTTKQLGTGLGLAIIHRIIQEHGGTIEVNSKEGEGAHFRLYFPRGEETARVA